MATTAIPVTVTNATPVTVTAAPPPSRVLVQETVIISINDPELKPAAGKIYIQGLGVLIALFSFAELIASSLVIHNSSGYYVGGIYVSILGWLFSFLLLSRNGLRHHIDIGWRLVLAWLNWVVCLIGMSITAAQYKFVNNLEACAAYSSEFSSSCDTTTPVQATCTGDSDYYPQAAACEANYAVDNDFDIPDDLCACVTSDYLNGGGDDDDGCYTYDYMNSCSDFLRLTPQQLATCLSFLVLMLITYFLLIIFLSLSRYNPEVVKTRAEREEEERNAANGINPGQLNTSLLSQQYVTSTTPVVYVNST